MTVETFLDHFNIYPSQIVFYDADENVEDTIYIEYVNADGKKQYDKENFEDFLTKYKQYMVTDWQVLDEDVSVYLEIKK